MSDTIRGVKKIRFPREPLKNDELRGTKESPTESYYLVRRGGDDFGDKAERVFQRFPRLLNITCLLITLCVLSPRAWAKVPVVSRSEWGADENLTLEQGIENKASEKITEDASRADQSEKNGTDEKEVTENKKDPEIKRVIDIDQKTGKKYLWPLQYAKKISFIVVHNTALTNNLDDPIKDIQSIYTSHAVARGWGDIGYHYLIDRNGTVYQGRKGGEKVVGGHAQPVNKKSIGIALMGNYETSQVTAPMLNSLIKLIDEKSKLYKINPVGKTTYKEKKYNNIQGHFENDATLCPGEYVKEALPDMRELVAYYQQFYDAKQPVASAGLSDSLSLAETVPTQATSQKVFSLLKKPEVIGIKPAQEKTITFRLRNNSNSTWNNETYLENINEETLPKKLGVLTASTKPGEIALFSMTIPSQMRAKIYMPKLRIIINGKNPTNHTFPFPILVENVEASYEVISVETPQEPLKGGESFTGKIRLKNTGNIPWQKNGPYALRLGTVGPIDHSSELFNNKNRIGILKQSTVEPGKTGTLHYTITQPKDLSIQHNESLQPIIDGYTWLTGDPIIISTVPSLADKPLRVRLTDSTNKRDAYQLSSQDQLVLLNSQNKPRIVFEKGSTIHVHSGQKSGYVILDSKTSREVFLSAPPRFATLREKGIIIIDTFEKRPTWNMSINDNEFREIIEIRKEKDHLYLINELTLESYMKGLAEVPNSDQLEKAKALAIAARSYAAYYRDSAEKFPGKPYHLDDNPDNTQKYLGAGFEARSQTALAAVEATKGLVITYNGKQVLTPYFSSSDGRTRSAQEVWGWENTPYLQSVSDPLCPSKTLSGHGVGLSGCGATGLAAEGKSAEEILAYYYKGIQLKHL